MPDALILDTEDEGTRLRVVYYPDLGGDVTVQWQACTGVTRGRKDWETTREAAFPARIVKVLAAEHLRSRFLDAAKEALHDEARVLWEEAQHA